MHFPKDCNPGRQCRNQEDIGPFPAVHYKYLGKYLGHPFFRKILGTNKGTMGHPFSIRIRGCPNFAQDESADWYGVSL